jgi:hypothetical protein
LVRGRESAEKRRKEVRRQEKQKDKAARKKLRKEMGPDEVGSEESGAEVTGDEPANDSDGLSPEAPMHVAAAVDGSRAVGHDAVPRALDHEAI